MGLTNSKNSWLCSDCGGRISTLDDVHNDLAPIQGVEPIIVDYEVTEFERCDEHSVNSPISYSNTGISSKGTMPSPLTPTKFHPLSARTRVISRNANNSSVNIVEYIRSSSSLGSKNEPEQ
ncbi:hypothetical protein SteCoe_31470 [Stentor coeruleus]|uniref:Uncharacterized protein n=1 Tax=Stentor coeruleus TaxID=5963 RepID=A0A1R2B185_9CILI|nr:hypothetical protein SteCoe_31470 [Stentor coeruleus]